MANGITVAYSGVHQAFQLALAAQEAGLLDAFLCSIYAAAGKWGGLAERIFGSHRLVSHRVNGLEAAKVLEYPWPLFERSLTSKLFGAGRDDWLRANSRFDMWAANQIATSSSSVFVGVETCSETSLEAARQRGMRTVLDCPGVEAEFLDDIAAQAAESFGLHTRRSSDSLEMRSRKETEIALADIVLLCSEFQRRTMHARLRFKKAFVVPLWVDLGLWRKHDTYNRPNKSALRVIYAGKINIRKGIVYLVKAVQDCPLGIHLTLVGTPDPELNKFLGSAETRINILPPTSKDGLSELYRSHDVLVLPTLGDSFGFVAMEAMACGLPVVVTENCGVPVPDDSWRVPVMDSNAIAERLLAYARDSELRQAHGQLAAEFVRQFTPARYRREVQKIFLSLLGDAEPAVESTGTASQG